MTQAGLEDTIRPLASPFVKQSKPLRDTGAQMTQMTALYQATGDPLASLDHDARGEPAARRSVFLPELQSVLHASPSPTGSCAVGQFTEHHTPGPMARDASTSCQVPRPFKFLSMEGAEGCIDHQRITLCGSSATRGKLQTSLQIFRTDGFRDQSSVPRSNNHFGVADLVFAGASMVFPNAFAKSLAASMIKLTTSTIAQMLHSKQSHCSCTDVDLWQHESQRRALFDHVAILFPMVAEKRQEILCQRATCAFEILRVALEDFEQDATCEMLQDHPGAVRATRCIASSLGRLEQDPADVVGDWAWTTLIEPLCSHRLLPDKAHRFTPSETNQSHLGVRSHGLPERSGHACAKSLDAEPIHASYMADGCGKVPAEAQNEDGHADIRLLPFTADGKTIEPMTDHSDSSGNSAASPDSAGRNGPYRTAQCPVSIISISDTEEQPERSFFRRSARERTKADVDYDQKRHILDEYLEGISTEHTGGARKRQRRSVSSTKTTGHGNSAQHT